MTDFGFNITILKKTIMIKRFVLSLALLLVTLCTWAEQTKSTVHLKSGEFVTGVITSRNSDKVAIISDADGQTYDFDMSEVDYISHEMKKKNYDTSKFRGFIDLGYSLGMGKPCNDYWLIETSFGYQFTPNYYLGAGLGVHNFSARMSSYPLHHNQVNNPGLHNDPDWKYPFIPIYLEGRYNYRSETYNTPFASLKVGTTFINHKGFFASPTIGWHFASRQFFSFNIGLAYELQTAKYKLWCSGDTPGAIPDDSGKTYLNKQGTFHNVALKVGVEF